jgi:hypothetical protein
MMFSQTNDMILELLKFNLGVEVGQIIVVALILLLFYWNLYHCSKRKRNGLHDSFWQWPWLSPLLWFGKRVQTSENAAFMTNRIPAI